MRNPLALLTLSLTLALAGCEPVLPVEGRVVDTRGQALPGVAVSLVDSSIQAQSDGRGRYRISCPSSFVGARRHRGGLELAFIKSGYGSSRLLLDLAGDSTTLAAPDVVLWPLPPEDGAFLLEEHRYVRMTQATVRPYRSPTRGDCFGTKTTATLATDNPAPPIFTHNMYGYDAQLVRLEQVDAVELRPNEPVSPGPETEYNETIWVAAQPIPVAATPIDEPERLLYQVQPSVPLEPGHYAVHWGALDVMTSAEKRLFLFDVVVPETESSETPLEAEASPSQ